MQAPEIQPRLNSCRPWIIAKYGEDTFQETCVRCYERLSKEKQWYPSYSIIKTIAMRIVIDAKRKQSTAAKWEDGKQADAKAANGSIGKNAQFPEAQCLDNELKRIVSDAIRRMRPEYASVITKIFYEGLTIQEIADESSIPKNTIKSWRTRGLTQLLSALRNNDYFADHFKQGATR